MEQNLINTVFNSMLTALEQHIRELVTQQVTAVLAAQPKQEAPQQTIDVPAFIDTLDKQEWFWEKLQRFVNNEVSEAIGDHNSEYDHDDYDNAVSTLNDYDLDYFVTKDDIGAKVEEVVDDRLDDRLDDKIEEKARDLLRNASISIDV